MEHELQQRIQQTNADSQRLRTSIRAGLPLVWDCPSGLTSVEWTENLTGERLDHPDDASPLFDETGAALEAKRTLSLNWPELVELHAETIARRRGESLSQYWSKTAKQAVNRVLEINELPDTITKEQIRSLIEDLRTKGLSDKTISTQSGVLQSLIQTGIEEDKLMQSAHQPD